MIRRLFLNHPQSVNETYLEHAAFASRFSLALFGAALGLVLSFAGIRLVQLTNAGGIPRGDEIVMDWRVLVFTLVTSVIHRWPRT